jgi:ferrous iron transport protein B
MAERHTIALAGNPNAGKTTLFNAMTGARQHVGNYPGITVEKKEGYVSQDGVNLHVIDLPGTYSLTAFSQEELVARNVIAEERPSIVIDVLNATVLERNFYLAVQLLEMGVPMILALNMIDEAEEQGLEIDTEKLSAVLHCPVVKTAAKRGRGVRELVDEATRYVGRVDAQWRPLCISYGPDLDPVLDEMVALIERNGFLTDRYPARWIGIKYLEGDDEIVRLGRSVGGPATELEELVARVADHVQKTLNTYPEALIADYRYGFISSVLKGAVTSRPIDRIALSDRMDVVLTHKIAGPAIMLAILYVIYQITFTVGEIPLGWVEGFFAWLGDTVFGFMPPGLARSLVVSGMIDGVGGVLSFVPLIMIIFAIIAFLEDSGYMARIAYMLDRVFRTFGLHGLSVMPYIVSGGIAGGCAVPGIMAARTLRSPREKLATILTAPFMTCGAKLPVFILLVGVFFARQQALALFCVTIGAWIAALVIARLLRSTIIRGEPTPFVMELPPYRLPTLRGVLIHTWERSWQYIKKAGTVILALSILLWALMTFPRLPAGEMAVHEARIANIEEKLEAASGTQADRFEAELKTASNQMAQASLRHSVAGRVGTSLEVVSEWAGFEWRTNIALLGGFAAKEVIVSTLGTAYSLGDVEADDASSLADRLRTDPNWTALKAVALMAFIMLYAPCFVAVVTIRQEAGTWGWAVFSMVFNTGVAFVAAVAIYQIGRLF